MPTHVRPNKHQGGFDIVEDKTGKVVGHSETKRNAEISSSKRTQAWHQKHGR